MTNIPRSPNYWQPQSPVQPYVYIPPQKGCICPPGANKDCEGEGLPEEE